MTNKITYISAEGLEKIKAELQYLKTVHRRELAERIDSAKALGDLSENAEYHEAKNDLAFTEGRIREIEDNLKNISVIPESHTGDLVNIGSTVIVEIKGIQKTYKIVGASEANPVEGLISNESPLGAGFLNHKVDDVVTIDTPAGVMNYKIVAVN